LGFICQQAGLPIVVDGDVVLCAYSGMRPPEWTLFVQAGMNDIDRRCDAYLAWLDEKRRSREPILKQLADMGAATAAILRATNTGATPIAIVGIAFGLAADTFTNISSRLLLEVNHSTVQSVVLGYQADFRANNARAIIDNRPAAIYLLRSYLRLCMPYSIEMSINNTVTIYHRDPASLNTEPLLLRTPLASRWQAAGALRESIPSGGSRTALPVVAGQAGGPSKPEFATDGKNDTERGIPRLTFMDIQRSLCVAPTGKFDEATRNAIQQAKLGNSQSGPNPTKFDNIRNQIESAAELAIFLKEKPCRIDESGVDRGYQTAFEKFAFPMEGGIVSLQILLASCDPRLKDKYSGKFDDRTRAAIPEAKKEAKKKGRLTDATNTLNDRSYNVISLSCR
jgi:hypothetical protein